MLRHRATISLLVLLSMLLMVGLGSPASAAVSSVVLKPILSGYDLPTAVANAGGGRTLYVVEQGGKIKIVRYRNGSYRKAGTLLDISDRVNDPTLDGNGEQGLLGLAFHPRYRQNGRFYVYYTRQGIGELDGDAVVAQFRRNARGSKRPTQANPKSERILMVIHKTGSFHNGGHVAFGPDGMLYIGLGDDGGFHDPKENGQDRSTLWGSLLRIDPRDSDGNGPRRYTVPRSNPFVGKPGRPQIWAYGLRNPWGFSFDRANGNLWIGDVGQDEREEVNKARSNRAGRNAARGANFGWADCEGFIEHNEDGDADDKCDQHVLPLYDYAHNEIQCSVTGGYVYRGPVARPWRGLYVAADYCNRLFVLDQRGTVRWSADSGINIAAFGEDAAGRLFAAGHVTGEVYRVLLRGPRPS